MYIERIVQIIALFRIIYFPVYIHEQFYMKYTHNKVHAHTSISLWPSACGKSVHIYFRNLKPRLYGGVLQETFEK